MLFLYFLILFHLKHANHLILLLHLHIPVQLGHGFIHIPLQFKQFIDAVVIQRKFHQVVDQ
jgi:hypothetical protein